jgi:hypothetical protein
MAAVERRRAVLEGLASLGYEVSEGMATAWVKEGRVVLRKARCSFSMPKFWASCDLANGRSLGVRQCLHVVCYLRRHEAQRSDHFGVCGVGHLLQFRGPSCPYSSRGSPISLPVDLCIR